MRDLSTESGHEVTNADARHKVLGMLDEAPYALLVERPDSDPVIATLGIRGIGTCELTIPKSRYDPLSVIEAIRGAVVDIICQAGAGVIDPEVFRANLTPEDMADIEAGRVSVEYLRCAAESMSRRKRGEQADGLEQE